MSEQLERSLADTALEIIRLYNPTLALQMAKNNELLRRLDVKRREVHEDYMSAERLLHPETLISNCPD